MAPVTELEGLFDDVGEARSEGALAEGGATYPSGLGCVVAGGEGAADGFAEIVE